MAAPLDPPAPEELAATKSDGPGRADAYALPLFANRAGGTGHSGRPMREPSLRLNWMIARSLKSPVATGLFGGGPGGVHCPVTGVPSSLTGRGNGQ